ncbi:polysaccharide biosynthesis protein [Desulfocastanea catecholica]
MKKYFFNMLFEQPRLLRTLALRKNFWIVLLLDILLIAGAHFLAYLVRFDWHISWAMPKIIGTIPFLLLAKIPIFYMFGLYRGMWRYTSTADLINITKAVCVSSGVIIMSVLFLNRFTGFSRSVFFMDGIFTFLFLCMHRGIIRYFFQSRELMSWFGQDEARPVKVRLLLIGAGAAAEKVIREIRDNVNVPYEVVGLVDDNYRKHGLKIHGIPVLGGVDNLQECIVRTRAEELLIAVASASAEQMQRIVDLCRKSKTTFKVLPSMGEIIRGKLSVTSSREISYKDLLGRPSVHLDQQEIGRYLTGKTVLVTGAGGSIGSELCRQIIRFEPKKIILLDAGEENLYKIQMELHHDRRFLDYVPVLCKIQNKALLDAIFTEYAPTVVFHAAAYKHVPLVEANPWEAVFNNVFVTKNLIEATIAHKVERFVLVSTDKAVRPTNVMGATKRVTELLMLAYCNDQVADRSAKQHTTAFMAVRFGNVLGSSGSVIPLFKHQIEKGGPVTVTDPEMTRYFMSIEEAAQLILQAGAMGGGGEIFILKMGASVKIVKLAHDLIKLLGYEPEKEIKIQFTGLRPGEKLYEELITEGEGIVPTRHEKIMVLQGDGRSKQEMEKLLSRLANTATGHDGPGIKEALHDIIPEYTPDLEAVAVVQPSNTLSEEFCN